VFLFACKGPDLLHGTDTASHP